MTEDGGQKLEDEEQENRETGEQGKKGFQILFERNCGVEYVEYNLRI